jgi:chromate reductase
MRRGMLGTGIACSERRANMSTRRDVAVIVGSLRRESLNRKLAHVLIDIAPSALTLQIVEIGALPLYNQDLDDDKHGPPSSYTEFRQRVKRADGLLFVTPEYNRSVPAPLKNAIDVGSRPYGKNVWAGKPSAIVSGSAGSIGGFGANHHLRQSFVFLDILAMQQPEAYISGVDKLFDESGRIGNESTRAFLGKFVQAYATWLDRLA